MRVKLTIVNELLSTKSEAVARFARNVEWDFFCDFQTPCFCGLLQFCIIHEYEMNLSEIRIQTS